MSTPNERFINSAVALTATTAFLYTIGTAKYGGYLSTLLLDNNVLDRNFHQVLYSGFLTLFFPIAIIGLVYLGGSYIYSHGILPTVIDWLRGSISAKRRFIPIRKFFFGKRKDTAMEKQAKRRTLHAGIAIIVLFTLLITLVNIEQQGAQEARKVIAKLDSGKFAPSEFIEITIDGNPNRLIHLACGSRNCAAINPDTRVVTYFPQQVYSYELASQKTKATAPTAEKK